MGKQINQHIYIDFPRGELLDLRTGEEFYLDDAAIAFLQRLTEQTGTSVSFSKSIATEPFLPLLQNILKDDAGNWLIQVEQNTFRLDGTVKEVPYPGKAPIIPPFSVLMMLIMVLIGFFLAIHYFTGR